MDMLRRDWAIPAVVLVLFAGFYVTITLVAGSDFLFRPVWDIDHYRAIAQRGYEIYPCDPAVHYPAGDICGNVGWFPAWPLAVKILSLGQVDIGIRILPYLFALAGFILLYRVLLEMADRRAALIGVIALAATPSAFYFLTGFPYAFLLFLFSLYLFYFYHPEARGRRYILPATALVFSLSYPSAFLAAIIPVIHVGGRLWRDGATRRIGALAVELVYHVLPFVLGPLLLSVYFYFRFDDFLLIVHFQEKYHRSWGFPPTVLWNSFLQFPVLYVENASVLFYGMVFLIFAPYRLKPELVAYLLLFYFFSPATGSVISVYRHYLLLFPAAMAIGMSSRPTWVKITYVLLGLAMALWRFFPIFMDGRLI